MARAEHLTTLLRQPTDLETITGRADLRQLEAMVKAPQIELAEVLLGAFRADWNAIGETADAGIIHAALRVYGLRMVLESAPVRDALLAWEAAAVAGNAHDRRVWQQTCAALAAMPRGPRPGRDVPPPSAVRAKYEEELAWCRNFDRLGRRRYRSEIARMMGRCEALGIDKATLARLDRDRGDNGPTRWAVKRTARTFQIGENLVRQLLRVAKSTA